MKEQRAGRKAWDWVFSVLAWVPTVVIVVLLFGIVAGWFIDMKVGHACSQVCTIKKSNVIDQKCYCAVETGWERNFNGDWPGTR